MDVKLRMPISLPQHLSREAQFRTLRTLISRLQANSGKSKQETSRNESSLDCKKAGGQKLKTAHFAVRTERVAQTLVFACAHVINAHALARDLTVADMWIVCLRMLIKSHSFVSCFSGTLIESNCDHLNPFSSFCSTPPLAQTSLLNTGMRMNPCVTPQ